ncbi:MAG: single-stranded-DNA-specific exonuclease RecJ [Betaproteobacteria bacterium]
MSIEIRRRDESAAAASLTAAGLTPLLARIYAARGVREVAEMQTSVSALPPPERLLHAGRAATRLADAIERGERMLIVADYDADGATACAVGVRGLRAYGAIVDFLVPNRFEYGYGLTPEIVAVAAQHQPHLLITVDNGIASVEGVAEANRRGIEVLVTDHHLPGAELPDACCIVNPNQAGCEFPSRNIAGVGVMFYVLLALRAELRRRGRPHADGFKLASLLDLVALGTVADVVQLDSINRILVAQGLARMRAGVMHEGIRALFSAAGRDPARATTYDLGFMLGPRLNAAGRLADMALGIRCLITDDALEARRCALELDRLNRERREIESGMTDEAQELLERTPPADAHTIALFQPDWHPGIVGSLASRLKDRWHRPAIAFARSAEAGRTGEIKGSGRSIQGFHLRDALDLVSKREPGVLVRFGGHAMAAGLTLREEDLGRFSVAWEQVAREWLTATHLKRVLETDGSLDPGAASMPLAEALRGGVWGQGFPAPAFDDTFTVGDQRWVGGRHLRLRLVRGGATAPARYDGIAFNQAALLPERVRAVYRLDVNEYQGTESLQLVIDHWEPA